jgi:anti-anti-sigma factor
VPDLTIQVQEIKGLAGTALVILNGSIDAKTVITFQTHLNSVKERGVQRFIMDMENVKYVNSTGLGYLINLSDTVGQDKGGISLVKVQPKVKVVFDMLGLNAFFKIFSTREEALKNLTAEPTVSSADQTVILKSPTQAAPSPSTVTATPRLHTPAAVSPPTARSVVAAPQAGTTGSAGSETLHVECQACRALLAVRDLGTYKCPRCLTPFTYQGSGKVNFLPRQKALPVQLSLNFSPECTEGLLEFVRRLSAKSGFAPGTISEVQSAVKETVDLIRRHAYGGSENNVYHVLLVSVDSELEMRFADCGASLNSDKGDLFGPVRRIMDRFELKNHPRGGNVVTLAKKAK